MQPWLVVVAALVAVALVGYAANAAWLLVTWLSAKEGIPREEGSGRIIPGGHVVIILVGLAIIGVALLIVRIPPMEVYTDLTHPAQGTRTLADYAPGVLGAMGISFACGLVGGFLRRTMWKLDHPKEAVVEADEEEEATVPAQAAESNGPGPT